MSNLAQRVLFGALGAALLLGCVWYSAWTFAVFFAGVQAKMLLEFYRMMRAGGYRPAALLGVSVSLILFAAVAGVYIAIQSDSQANNNVFEVVLFVLSLAAQTQVYGSVLLLVPIMLIVREMIVWPRFKNPFGNVAINLLGLFYVTLPMTLLIMVGHNEDNGYDPRRILALLLLVWSSDIGAYAAGKTWGKHKLAPNISPGKTWEGAIGGFLLTLGMGWALGYLLPELSLAYRLVVAAVVAVFGPLGDLAESMLKRSVSIKDSGRILPGHGGLLDRFDAFLFILPVLALLQLLVG